MTYNIQHDLHMYSWQPWHVCFLLKMIPNERQHHIHTFSLSFIFFDRTVALLFSSSISSCILFNLCCSFCQVQNFSVKLVIFSQTHPLPSEPRWSYDPVVLQRLSVPTSCMIVSQVTSSVIQKSLTISWRLVKFND